VDQFVSFDNLKQGHFKIFVGLVRRAVKTGYSARIGPTMTGSDFVGPSQKGPEDKRAQKYLPKSGPLQATGFRASPIT